MHLFWKSFKCKVCGSKFKTQQELDSHMSTHAAQPTTPPQLQSQSFKCDKCSAVFNTKEELDSHLKTHTTESTDQLPPKN
ncbi:C2H2-type zinc finger protein [Candidatus Parvarchaeota archaeon]|nr:C2H2-type zinc finger protein [Candidatus Parvarchaeota archaeon]